jgi:hypothetical protein
MVKSLSFQTMGEEYPVPGTLVFQITLVSESQWVGRFFSGLDPSPFGPRHPGQFCAFRSITVCNIVVKAKLLIIPDFLIII